MCVLRGTPPLRRTPSPSGRRAGLIAFAVLAIFAVTGLRVLTFFGVSVAAVQIAGGLILVRVAFDLLRGEASLTVTCADEADQRIHRGDEFPERVLRGRTRRAAGPGRCRWRR